MPTWTMKGGAAAGRYDLSWDTPVEGNGETMVNPTLTPAMAADDWTKSAADAGSAEMPAAHTIVDDDLVDVYWAAGYRAGMTAAVTGTTVALSGGDGDDLPASDTAVILSVQVALSVAFTGNLMHAMVGSATIRSLLSLLEADGTAHLFEILPTCGLSWKETDAAANPLADKTIASGALSTTDTTSEKPVTFGILFDATPDYPG